MACLAMEYSMSIAWSNIVMPVTVKATKNTVFVVHHSNTLALDLTKTIVLKSSNVKCNGKLVRSGIVLSSVS